MKRKLKKKVGIYWAYDIFIEPNYLIEVNGDYWHGNPKLYKSNDLILKGSSKEFTVESKWKKDSEKILAAKNAKFKLLVIWELDWKINKIKEIDKIIKFIKS